MLEAMTSFPAPLSWVIPLPFYFLEILVGFIQATVFMLLTAIFTMVSCSYEESH
jgi:F-type H+-transporting ATPase subunit a